MIVEETENWLHCLCDKCGLRYKVSSRRKRNTDHCSSCRATPLKSVTYGKNGYCVPWHGDFNEFENPMKDGQLYKPGIRTCGHRDCVRDVHITVVAGW